MVGKVFLYLQHQTNNKKLHIMKNVIASTTKKVDLVALMGFLEYYLPIINFHTPTKINQGGCGFFAIHLNKVLVSMGVDSQICYAISSDDETNMKYLTKNNKMPKNRFGINHCLVNITPYLSVDCDGIKKPLTLSSKFDENVVSGIMTAEQMQVLWDNVPSWNEIFDRDCCDDLAKRIAEIPAKFERFLVEGYIDLPVKNKGIKMTKKTIDAMQCGNPLSALLRGLSVDDNDND